VKAIAVKTSTNVLRDIVIDEKVRPIGDNPKNKPTRPSRPKVKATDRTNCSTTSSLFLFMNRTLTNR